MGRMPKDLVEMQHIGVRTRERMAAARDVPAFADCGLTLAGLSEAAPDFGFTRLTPDMHQLLACLEGRGDVWVDGAWRPLEPGAAYFTPAGTPHAYRAGPTGTWRLCWTMYAPTAPPSPRFIPTQPVVVALNSRPLWLAIEGLCEAVAHGGQNAERELWTRLIHHHVLAALAPTQSHDPRLASLWSAVDTDLAHPWTLAELARRAGMSREALRRACLRENGQSPLRELSRRRLHRAADLLRHTPDKIAAIAARVGFGDPFAFSTAFKRARGHTPRAYRGKSP
jgi:AraC-like DNA-binding protein/mannose-6-phosphate isomerase-like protein (cupin superfamily)